MRRKKPICMTPGCTQPATKRGVCDSCYVAARRMVASHIVGWDELESLELILPSQTEKAGPFIVAYRKAVMQNIKNSKRQRRR